MLRQIGTNPGWQVALWFWAFVILLVTLATKQHMLADIAAGTVLAFGIYACVFYQSAARFRRKTKLQTISTNITEPHFNNSMKISQILCLLAGGSVLFCWTSVVRADEEADRAALRVIKASYEEAVNTGNLSKLAPYASKDVTGVMVTGEAVQGFEGLQAYWKKIQDLIGPGGSYQVNVNVDKTDLVGDVAVSRGSTAETVRLPNGKELKFSSLWTAICRKEGGAWKVTRMQATMDPVNNVFVATKLNTAKLLAGVGGLLLGAVLVVLTALLRRKRVRATESLSL